MDELKEDYMKDLKLQASNSNGSIMDEEDKRSPEQVLTPKILTHINQVD